MISPNLSIESGSRLTLAYATLPCAAPIGPATAKQAAPAADSSIGQSGVTPPALGIAGGVLERH